MPEYKREELLESLEAGGYYTEGFEGSSVEEYRKWHKAAFQIDPFQTAEDLARGRFQAEQAELQALGGKQARRAREMEFEEGFEPTLEWISGHQLGWEPDIGWTGTPEEGEELVYGDIQARLAERRTEREYELGLGMLRWLAESAGDIDPMTAQAVQMAAGARIGREYAPGDYSGHLAQRYTYDMAGAAAAQEPRRNMLTDVLLPSLLTIGGGMGGRGGMGGFAGGGFGGGARGTGPGTPLFDIT